jgi:hypothetical protein
MTQQAAVAEGQAVKSHKAAQCSRDSVYLLHPLGAVCIAAANVHAVHVSLT